MQNFFCDVLIIGAGGAGLRAAIAARETFPSGKIIVVTKGKAGLAGVTALACSDRMAFHATLPYTEPGGADNWKHHAEDIYRLGGYVSDGDLAAILARESAAAFSYLDALGVPFAKTPDGRAHQFITDGSDYPRACYTGPTTAIDMEKALLARAVALDIEFVNHCLIAELVVIEGQLRGAIGLAEDLGGVPPGIKLFNAKTVILACGGAGEAFAVHVYPPGMTGDGYALAYRAGAELVNLEFIQIGPASIATKLNCSGSVMRAVPRLVNDRNEEFLSKYLPGGMSAARMADLVFAKGASWPTSREKDTYRFDVAVFQEILRGERVYLDFSKNPEGFSFRDLAAPLRARYDAEIKKTVDENSREGSPYHRLQEINPETVIWLKERGIDLARGDRVEIAPCIQHFQGGVKIGINGETRLPGLYAAGECAGGQHGANRPGGNALLDGQVFGARAGRAAAKEAMTLPALAAWPPSALDNFFQNALPVKKGIKAAAARKAIQKITASSASVIRGEAALKAGIGELADLRRAGIGPDENGPAYWCETENLLLVAEMILRAALARRESRGPHLFFADPADMEPLPVCEPEGRYYSVISKGPEGMILEKRTPRSLDI